MSKTLEMLKKFLSVYIIPSWSTLNALGKSRILKSSYLWLFIVPLISKFLLNINDQLTFSIFGANITVNMSLPFSWQMFYFGSVGIALASLFYSLGCPEIVKEFHTYKDFQDKGKTANQLKIIFADLLKTSGLLLFKKEEDRRQIIIRKFLEKYADDQFNTNEYEEKFIISDFENIPMNHQTKIIDAFWYVRNYADNLNLLVRSITFFGYVTGFIFILLVLAQNFRYVIKLIT